MDDNKFWLSIFKLIASVVVVLILSVSGYSFNEKRAINEMVKNGADPITARCSLVFDQSAGQAIICAMQAGVISK